MRIMIAITAVLLASTFATAQDRFSSSGGNDVVPPDGLRANRATFSPIAEPTATFFLVEWGPSVSNCAARPGW